MSKKFDPIRWQINQAANEFNLDGDTLTKRLRAASIEPGTDGKFSTAQIVEASFGDLDKERTRNEAAKADRNEMARDTERKNLIPAEYLRGLLEELKVAITQVIDHSALSAKEKENIYGNLRKLGENDFEPSRKEDSEE